MEEYLVCGEGDEQGGAWQEKVIVCRDIGPAVNNLYLHYIRFPLEIAARNQLNNQSESMTNKFDFILFLFSFIWPIFLQDYNTT